MIKTILCDLGNVIINVHDDIKIKNLKKFSSKSEKFIKKFLINSKARKDFDKGKISAIQLYKNLKDNLNLRLDFKQFKKAWCSYFSRRENMEKLLRKLKKTYRLILLSNTDEIHFSYIRKKYKILGIFDDFVLSYKVGYTKPNPLIYLHAIKKAKTFPNKTVYIDDIKSYVLAAKFFGIKSLQYTTFSKLKADFKKLNIKN